MTHGDNDEKGDLIDQNLKKVYDSILSEDVPDRFARLIAQLQAGELPQDVASDDEESEGTQQ